MLALAKGADRAIVSSPLKRFQAWKSFWLSGMKTKVECRYLVRTVWADNIIVHEASFRVLQVT